VGLQSPKLLSICSIAVVSGASSVTCGILHLWKKSSLQLYRKYFSQSVLWICRCIGIHHGSRYGSKSSVAPRWPVQSSRSYRIVAKTKIGGGGPEAPRFVVHIVVHIVNTNFNYLYQGLQNCRIYAISGQKFHEKW